MPRIVLVEDDPDWELQAELAFEAGLPPECELDLIETEGEFVERIEKHAFERKRPDLFVLDLMLPWDIPRPNMRPAPKEVRENGFFRAGVRCHRRLANSVLAPIPVVFWTIVERDDLTKEYSGWPPNITYIPKDPDLRKLLTAVRSILKLA